MATFVILLFRSEKHLFWKCRGILNLSERGDSKDSHQQVRQMTDGQWQVITHNDVKFDELFIYAVR